MDEQSANSGENPLDDFASKLGDALHSQAVDMNDVSANHVEGGQIHINSSAARTIRGHAVYLDGSATGFVKSDAADIDDSVVGVIVSNQVSADEVRSASVVAQDVNASTISTLLLLSGRVDGKVRAVLTPFTALAFGVGVGLSILIVKGILSRLWPFRRKKRNRVS